MRSLTQSINDLLVMRNATGVSATEIADVVREFLRKKAKGERIETFCAGSMWHEIKHNARAELLDELQKL